MVSMQGKRNVKNLNCPLRAARGKYDKKGNTKVIFWMRRVPEGINVVIIREEEMMRKTEGERVS
jgi:hypothetical protein